MVRELDEEGGDVGDDDVVWVTSGSAWGCLAAWPITVANPNPHRARQNCVRCGAQAPDLQRFGHSRPGHRNTGGQAILKSTPVRLRCGMGRSRKPSFISGLPWLLRPYKVKTF